MVVLKYFFYMEIKISGSNYILAGLIYTLDCEGFCGFY
jgi:hypothetical protein